MRWRGVLCAALLTGCYSTQQLPLAQLDALTAAPGRRSERTVAGEACAGCEVTVDPTTPLLLTSTAGERHRLTPFAFQIVDDRIVGPEQGVLLDRNEVVVAEVQTFSPGRTTALIAGVALLAAASFVAIRLTAGEGSLSEDD